MKKALLAMAVLLVLTAILVGYLKSGAASNQVDLKRALVAKWSAETSAGDAASGFRTVLTGAVTVVSVPTDKMFSFAAGRGSVTVSNAPKLNFGRGENFSVTARIQPQRADTDFGVMAIVDKRQVGGIAAARGYCLHLEYGRLACQLAPAARWPLGVTDFTSLARLKAWWQLRKQLVPMTFARYIATGPDLRDGKFHNVALTVERMSPTGGKLYVDGEVVLSLDPRKQSASLANNAPFQIGGHADPALNCGFQGLIGDVRLYSRALTEAEVKALQR